MFIERAFGRLKGKYRRLFYLYVKTFAYGMDHILSSFVLHNFILLEGRESDGVCFMQPQQPNHNHQFNKDDNLEEENDEDIMNGNDADGEDVAGGRAGYQHPLLAQSKIAGHEKRENISHRLMELLNDRV
ncbi:uncharacterized protein LOC117642346 [Thrips palmi]|uniref:Uncharacterized protein LOC117642346 n=1 Tax=Thrips palmi TaxID=161013 RepID=A0A6P8YH93_THRPL|nr:uncharacterized protein LOC117642346 [Thrips palmi]